MNNLFSIGLLFISIVVLNGCKESVDVRSNSYSSSHTVGSASTTSQTAADMAPTSIISTPAGVTVIKVVNVTDTEATQSNTGTNNTNTSGSGTNTNSSNNTSTTGNTSTTTDSETNTDNSETIDPVASTSRCEEAFVANPIEPFVRVQLHYGLLSNAPYIVGELGGVDSLTVTEDAAQNAKVLKLDSTVNLVAGQLITYEGTNGNIRVAEIGEVSANQVTIISGRGLETKIAAGSNISNFYYDPTHPNVNGYKAMADFGFRSARSVFTITPNQTHVLLGDSWFDASAPSGASEFAQRISVRLPGSPIFNEGIGGNTLCDLINRFDTDVAPKNPQYVWINSSINDYFNDVSSTDFKTRMQFLISKIQAIGAEAIVFDSAPATGVSFGGNDLTVLSNRYATALLDLFEESQL